MLHTMKYIYNTYKVSDWYKSRVPENSYLYEYILKHKLIDYTYDKSQSIYVKYVKYDLNNPELHLFTKLSINLFSLTEHMPIIEDDLPRIYIFLDYSYNLMHRLNRISYQNIIINYKKQYKYKWSKFDTLLHIKNKNTIVIAWLKTKPALAKLIRLINI